MKLLIDADVVAYQAAASVEHIFCEEETGLCFPIGNVGEAEARFHLAVKEAAAALGEDDAAVMLAFSCPHEQNFRRRFDASYKANRNGKPRPVVLPFLLERLQKDSRAVTLPYLEADDVLGVLATSLPEPTVILSIDKDMKTIPGRFLDLRAAREGENVVPCIVTPEEADRAFYRQVLTGDTADNYPGCPGIGPKKADEILDKAAKAGVSLWAAVVAAYEKAGRTEQDALHQANLARILRAHDYVLRRTDGGLLPWHP